MHTSVTTHHRIFFSNVTNYGLLAELTEVLGMEPTADKGVYDLVQSEGESTIVCDALYDTLPERLVPVGCRDSYDMTFDEVVATFKKLALDENVTLISRLFDLETYTGGDNDTDLDCDDLFDLLSVLGNTHFKVDGIFSQWAMCSNKNEFGAHAGGTQITTQYFCVPVAVYADRAETVIRTLAKHTPEEMGDYFFNEFINPIMDRIFSAPLKEAVEAASARFFGFQPSYMGVHMEKTGMDWTKTESAKLAGLVKLDSPQQ